MSKENYAIYRPYCRVLILRKEDLYVMSQLIRTSLSDEAPATDTKSLRPSDFDSYIGQTENIANLSVYIKACQNREEALDHVIMYGPAGLGKTTLAQVIANELHQKMKITSAPAIEKPGELVALLNTLDEGDVLFIDEIHRLSKTVEEVLYSAMEDFAIDITVGKDAQMRSIRLNLPHFTLIGATTRMGMISAPLRDRFGITLKMNYYSPEELSQIIHRSSQILNFPIDEAGADTLSKCCRGTPRIANNLLKRCVDFAMSEHSDIITKEIVELSLERLSISKNGLNEQDRRLLNILSPDKPTGLSTIACMLGEDEGTIESVLEPYLIYCGYINKTPQGRIRICGKIA